MNKKNKSDFVVFSKGYFRFIIFCLLILVCYITSCIYTYFIENKPKGYLSPLSILSIIFWIAVTIFIIWLYNAKGYVKCDKITVKKWYGLKKTYSLKDIDKVVCEKGDGKIVSAKIITKETQDRFIDEKMNFEKLLDYLLKNVDKEKIVCYQLGTKNKIEL